MNSHSELVVSQNECALVGWYVVGNRFARCFCSRVGPSSSECSVRRSRFHGGFERSAAVFVPRRWFFFCGCQGGCSALAARSLARSLPPRTSCPRRARPAARRSWPSARRARCAARASRRRAARRPARAGGDPTHAHTPYQTPPERLKKEKEKKTTHTHARTHARARAKPPRGAIHNQRWAIDPQPQHVERTPTTMVR